MKRVSEHQHSSVQSVRAAPKGSSPPGGAKLSAIATALLLAGIGTAPITAHAFEVKKNPICTDNTAFYSPGNGEDIVVPKGFQVSVFAQGLNAPVGIAFRGNKEKFEVYVLESGHGLPSRCNDETSPVVGGENSPTNPFTPDILVFNQDGGKPIRG